MSEMSTPMTSPAFSCDYQFNLDSMNCNQQPKREKRRYRCRKRSPATIERAKVVRRDKANARERRRMNSLNDALERLRTILPHVPEEPKMTKIETLRVAQGYIRHLAALLAGENPGAFVPPPTQLCYADEPSPQFSDSYYPTPQDEYNQYYFQQPSHS